jgi:hypothetical protein
MNMKMRLSVLGFVCLIGISLSFGSAFAANTANISSQGKGSAMPVRFTSKATPQNTTTLGVFHEVHYVSGSIDQPTPLCGSQGAIVPNSMEPVTGPKIPAGTWTYMCLVSYTHQDSSSARYAAERTNWARVNPGEATIDLATLQFNYPPYNTGTFPKTTFVTTNFVWGGNLTGPYTIQAQYNKAGDKQTLNYDATGGYWFMDRLTGFSIGLSGTSGDISASGLPQTTDYAGYGDDYTRYASVSIPVVPGQDITFRKTVKLSQGLIYLGTPYQIQNGRNYNYCEFLDSMGYLGGSNSWAMWGCEDYDSVPRGSDNNEQEYTCSGTIPMDPAWIGKTVYIDCCPNIDNSSFPNNSFGRYNQYGPGFAQYPYIYPPSTMTNATIRASLTSQAPCGNKNPQWSNRIHTGTNTFPTYNQNEGW